MSKANRKKQYDKAMAEGREDVIPEDLKREFEITKEDTPPTPPVKRRR